MLRHSFLPVIFWKVSGLKLSMLTLTFVEAGGAVGGEDFAEAVRRWW